MQWDGPILTDSGGFQVMSLAKLAKMGEDGVRFQSHIDGSEHMLTPERSIEIQTLLGANIRMVLDECTSFPATHEVAQSSMHLSTRWAARSKTAFEKYDAGKGDALFGIVQGGVYEDLRHESAAALIDVGFDGYAVGGLAVGEGHDEMLRVLDFTVPALPADAPRYLMGVGTPHDLVHAVARGIDMFDCVMPTRAGRHGLAYTRRGKVNLRNARHAHDPRPLDDESAVPPPANIAVPICIICSNAMNIWGRCCCHGTICIITSNSWATCARRLRQVKHRNSLTVSKRSRPEAICPRLTEPARLVPFKVEQTQ